MNRSVITLVNHKAHQEHKGHRGNSLQKGFFVVLVIYVPVVVRRFLLVPLSRVVVVVSAVRPIEVAAP